MEEKERGGEKEDMHLEEPNRAGVGVEIAWRRRCRRRRLTNPSKKKRMGRG
jgi:hypothetical protein